MEAWVMRTLIWAVFGVAISGLCMWKTNAARLVVGVFFAIMALGVHGTLILSDPRQYQTFAQGAFIPVYREVAVAIVSISPLMFGIGMLVFELVLAALMLSYGTYARLGFTAAILFLVGIMPLGPEEVANVFMAAGVAYLATRNFQTAVVPEVRAWLRARSLRHLAPTDA